jgi:hypothetical protein
MTFTNGVLAAYGITYKMAEGGRLKVEDQRFGNTGGHSGPPF